MAGGRGRAYRVKEIHRTLQGEGARSGRVAVFCRFATCNLWSGLEVDRARAQCRFCDTDFVGTDGHGGGVFESAEALATRLLEVWRCDGGLPRGRASAGLAGAGGPAPPAGVPGDPYVVFTGGEPALQLDAALVDACHDRGLELAVETNGTLPLPGGLDWITVSPKAGTALAQRSGQELKLVWPQELDPRELLALDFEHFLLQPMDGADYERNLAATLAHCLSDPRWRLSLQTHKLLGIP